MTTELSDEEVAGQLVLTAISPFVVGIFTKSNSGDVGWTYGTGSAIEFDHHKVILTAAHVVPRDPSDIQFMAPPTNGFRISRSLKSESFRKSQRYDLKCCIGDHELDLAAIVFNTPPELTFFKLSSLTANSPSVGSQVAICGYPIAKEKMVLDRSEVRSCARPDFQCAKIISAEPFSNAKQHQFAIDYPQNVRIVDPGGYSGAMVWYIDADCSTIENFERTLTIGAAGIVTHHSPSERALLGTRVNCILGFIRDQVIGSL